MTGGGPRNFGPEPHLIFEGYFTKPLDVPKDVGTQRNWARGLRVADRLNWHHTLSSARRNVHFKNLSGLIADDSLDVAMESDYDHNNSSFADAIDVITQRVTMGLDDRKRLRNTVVMARDIDAIGAADEREKYESWGRSRADSSGGHQSIMSTWRYPKDQYGRYEKSHAVFVSGLRERTHPSTVKLLHSTHHAAKTLPGYSRQDMGGNTFHY